MFLVTITHNATRLSKRAHCLLVTFLPIKSDFSFEAIKRSSGSPETHARWSKRTFPVNTAHSLDPGRFNFVMGLPEYKVKLFEDDPKSPPPTTVVDENEEDANFCQLTCVSLVFLVTFGVFFALVVFPSPLHDEDSYNAQGLFISQYSFSSFHLP